MNGGLGAFQSAFAKALFDPNAAFGLSEQPAFAVYRNTVMSGCIDALEANFPSVVRLVGVDWFRAAAAAYVRLHPPSDGRMLAYGEHFGVFLGNLETARNLPYLAGVAQLDRLWIEAHAAENAQAVDGASLAGLSPDAIGALCLVPHPAARWRWFHDLPVYSIWQRNRVADNSLEEIEWRGEGALLTRPRDAVEWHRAGRAECALLDACAEGLVLGEAAAAALDAQPDADIATLMAGLLCAGALACSTFNPGSSA